MYSNSGYYVRANTMCYLKWDPDMRRILMHLMSDEAYGYSSELNQTSKRTSELQSTGSVLSTIKSAVPLCIPFKQSHHI